MRNLPCAMKGIYPIDGILEMVTALEYNKFMIDINTCVVIDFYYAYPLTPGPDLW